MHHGQNRTIDALRELFADGIRDLPAEGAVAGVWAATGATFRRHESPAVLGESETDQGGDSGGVGPGGGRDTYGAGAGNTDTGWVSQGCEK